jgi:hypothetical membrane protein
MASDAPPMADGPPPRQAVFSFVPFGRADICGTPCVGNHPRGERSRVASCRRSATCGQQQREPFIILWVTLQALFCALGGVFQEARKRPRWEVLVVGFIAAALILIIAVGVGNATPDSNTGTTVCSRESPCDTSYGIGGIFIMGNTVPFYVGITAIGRGLAVAITRIRR